MSVTRRIRLTYADTDPAGLLYYAAWFPWMERMLVEWAHGHGFRYDRMLAEHGAAPVATATTCDYTAPVGVYDEVEMAMRVAHVGTSSYRMGFEMTRVPDAVLVARATLSLVCVDGAGRPTPIPAAYRTILSQEAS